MDDIFHGSCINQISKRCHVNFCNILCLWGQQSRSIQPRFIPRMYSVLIIRQILLDEALSSHRVDEISLPCHRCSLEIEHISFSHESSDFLMFYSWTIISILKYTHTVDFLLGMWPTTGILIGIVVQTSQTDCRALLGDGLGLHSSAYLACIEIWSIKYVSFPQ